jgi:CDGSH-type Zn-finger protein
MSGGRPRAVKVVAYPDGPYLVRGDFEILDARGNPMEVRRKTVALCRCGLSQIKPFCDGTHVSAGFRAR